MKKKSTNSKRKPRNSNNNQQSGGDNLNNNQQSRPLSLRIKSFFSSFFGALTVIGTLAGIVALVFPTPLSKILKSEHEKFIEANYVRGELHPPPITAGYSILEKPPSFLSNPQSEKLPHIKGILLNKIDSLDVIISMGQTVYLIKTAHLYKGIEIHNPLECGNPHIIFGIKDNRLYVSAVFKDLEKEEVIGFIEFNHWNLYQANLMDFKNDDERLEVKDKQNNIVFAIKYAIGKKSPIIFVSGYFITPESVLVLNNNILNDPIETCFVKKDSLWKVKASKEISNIKSIF